jgi:hypothetical protein
VTREQGASTGIRDAGHDVAGSRWVGWLGRTGLVAQGAIHAIIGVLAIEVAVGLGGKTTNQAGAMTTLVHEPFGKILLVGLAVGLFAFAAWRLVRALVGHGPEGDDDALQRLGGVVGGIGYLGLFVTAVTILVGSHATNGSPDRATGGVLGWPGGQLLVVAVGVVLICVGIGQGYIGVRRKFVEETRTDRMGAAYRKAFTGLGVFGHLARMVVFTLIGYFLIKAAVDFDPRQAVSIDGALAALSKASYGPAVLGVVAAGLIAFAAYSFADAPYRRV